MNSLASHGGSHRPWHTDSDVGTRRMIAENILHLFEKRKPQQEWQHRLPELVKRLEESLYRDASSKEEYADISTLEQRLHAIVKRGQARNNLSANVRGANASSSSTIPTPGVSASMNGSTMIPTPGTINTNSNSLGNVTASDTMTSISTVNNMVPTPGINNMLTSANTSAVNAGKSMMSGAIQLQQQVYNSSPNGITSRNVNGELGGNVINNMQRKFPYMSGSMATGTLNFPNPPMYTAPHFGNMAPQSSQRTSQQRHQNMPIQSTRTNHLVLNSPELASPGSYYNSASNVFVSNRLNTHAQSFQTSKMIPVPGLPSDQSSLQSQKRLRQSQLQGGKFMPVNAQSKGTMGNQQQKESIVTGVSFVGEDVKPTVLSAAHSQQESQLTTIASNDSQHHTTAFKQSSEECGSIYRDSEKQKQHVSSSPVDDHQLEIGKYMQQHDHEQQVTQQSRLQQTMKAYPQQKAAQETRDSDGLNESTDNGISVSQVGNTAGNLSGKPLPNGITDSQKAQLYVKQQRWLLILRHASKCTAPEGQCQVVPQCHTARQLCMHIAKCTVRDCQYVRCQVSRTLIRHHQNCREAHCPVCGPVRQKMALQCMKQVQSNGTGTNNAAQSSCQRVSQSATVNLDASPNRHVSMPTSSFDVQVPLAKRPKLDSTELVDNTSDNREALKAEPNQATFPHVTPAVAKVNVQPTSSTQLEVSALTNDQVLAWNLKIKSEQGGEDVSIKQIPSNAASNKTSIRMKREAQQEKAASPVAESGNATKSSKPKIKGVSLTELFTPEQIKEHITSLRQWVGQSKAKAEKNQAMEHRMNESSCQLCAVETLTFDPPPIYCTPCGVRIKRNAFYWTMQIGETRHYVCVPCYNDPRAETVDIDGVNYPKLKLEKRKNDEETDEPWVQCDKCEKWQHQVCALFNMRRNEGGQAEYTCPHCLIKEIEQGERKPLPQSAVLGAKDLPRTLLSDHIEQRLLKKLKQERHERARAQGKSFDEVPGADSLVIRIVSSVDKKLEVKQRFLEMFQSEGYTSEFPYKSKVLLLFQKIEGVEVCLFGMYVQEFGADAAQPNQRRVYLSYLDSVKYFRPDVRTINGEALRTFVYHEILIGYLEYCKKRGFTSCYIWACPPLKGEDYILYCHPEIQKTPKSDKLREWYLSMLHKASNENVVVELTNMHDHFFTCTGEAKARVTAARLPYFDGDYWPGAAEDMIMQLQEEEIEQRQQKKGKTKKIITKRAAKTAAQPELACNASKDLQLMHKLGETIYPMKEDFIMVHLQFCCTHCCNFILCGRHWICKQCNGFQICDRCYDAEQKRDERERHPCCSKEFHPLVPVESNECVNDTKDKDEIVESEFFDTRQAFLSLCQGNHYQYDTLRRAKHSSMMVLYHLHNPTAPAFVTTCNKCHHDIETGQGWRCETCPDFDLCNSCYSKDDSEKHPHKLTPHPSAAEREAQSKEARQQRVLQLRKMLDLLVHASQCGSAQCLYPNCRRVKGLFRHGICCKVRASGGCHLCKKMWYLLQLHARACKESECRVPRCKDLKEHLRRLQQQMESRRRAAVKEMMRQRTAEATAGTS